MSRVRGDDAFGSAAVEPATARAGESGTWTLTWRAGNAGLRAGQGLVIHTDSDTDWEEPQTLNPDASGYLRLELPGSGVDGGPLECEVTVITVKRIDFRLRAGALGSGQEIRMVFGAGKGLRMQTFAEQHRYFLIDHVDADGRRTRLAEPPSLHVFGSSAVRLAVLNPSTAESGASIALVVKAEDRWGNPASGFAEQVTVCVGEAQRVIALPADRAAARVELPAPVTEAQRFFRPRASCEACSTLGNPILVVPRGAATDGLMLWGDFHGGQLVDPRKIAAYYEYARDVSALAFSSYQRNDHETSDADWEIQKNTDKAFHRPDDFVALPGYEWSADTHLGGDRNVLYPRHGLPLLRSSFSAVAGKQSDPGQQLPDQRALYNHYRLTDAVLVPHVGGRPSHIELHEPQLEPVVEIASTHGTFEWFYLEALRRGYKVGVVAGSDGYTGRPGGEFPGYIARRFSRSGATAIRAGAHTLEGILDAARARRTYATSGPRIYLDVRAAGSGAGDEMRVAGIGADLHTVIPPQLSVVVHGTAPIDRIDVFRRDRLVHTHVPAGGDFDGGWRLLMTGAAAWRCYSGVQWLGSMSVPGGLFTHIVPLRLDSPRSRVSGAGSSTLSWDTTNCGYAHGFEFRLGGAAGAAVRSAPAFSLAVECYLYNGMYSGAETPGTMRISRAPAEKMHLVGTFPAGPRIPDSRTVDLGPAGRALCLEPVIEERPEEVEMTYTDAAITPGVHPYWVRVTQRDMHSAWSSPVFVHYAGQTVPAWVESGEKSPEPW